MARWLGALVLAVAHAAWALGALSGNWSTSLQLLPTLKLSESGLTLRLALASFRVESESTFYHDGLRYQSFYASGKLAEFDIWGRISFHAQDIRYRKAWINIETKHGGGTIRLSLNHWSALGEYTSSDKDKFGPWPCSNTVSWNEAWYHIGRTLYVEGPVAGYEHAGALRIHLGRPSPDPNRFDVYISASNVPKFEEAFGARFWESWVGTKICVQGTVKGYRWTSGGPRDGGYSVAEVAISSPTSLSLGGCCGYPTALICSGNVIRWFEAHRHDGETIWIQGPVVSITGPAAYYGYANHYRVRIGGGAAVMNRVEVIAPARPGWSTVGSSYSREVCVYGKVTVISGVAVILPADIIMTRDEPCCSATLLPGMLLNQRLRLRWAPLTITLDLADCGTGSGLKRIAAALEGHPLCCGLRLDAAATLSACYGLEKVALTLRQVSLGCCGLTADVGSEFTPRGKAVTFLPRWPRISGCLTVYGDVLWREHSFAGIAVYGWRISCSFARVKLRLVTALDPDAVEEMTDVTFYAHEFEYVGITYTDGGGCAGTVTSSAELWFGTRGTLFGLQRVRLKLEVPLSLAAKVFAKGQWNFAKAEPLDWFDVGWKVSF